MKAEYRREDDDGAATRWLSAYHLPPVLSPASKPPVHAHGLLAGGYDLWYSMMTTTPNEVVKPIHPRRMPVMLDSDDYDTWLIGSPDNAAKLLKPFAADQMQIAMEGGKSDDMRQVVI